MGAGPGDPGLITARGLDLLRRADVVVFDALANPRLLDHAPPGARRIDVGKRARAHGLSQEQINQLLVDHASSGQLVVRLKGGDPYLFGRGAEEVTYLATHGVACEVVPGVTAGVAVPAAAGIPVTHRGTASTVTFVAGHEDPTKDQPAIDYRSLAGLILAGGTVCFYMGVGRLDAIAQALRRGGLPDQTPAAVIQWGTLPRQRTVRTRLASAASDASAVGLAAPAIIVVGSVAGLDEPGLDHFTQRPLFGQRVVITRPRHQAWQLRRMLDDLGAETLEAPTIQLAPPDDWSDVDKAINHIDQFDWLVVTSVNGVNALGDRLDGLGLDARHLATVKCAVIGDGTAAALRQRLGIRADLIPDQYVAESLAESLITDHGVKGKRLLLLRADIARTALPTLLTHAGGRVTDLAVYQTKATPALPQNVLAALRTHEVDWVMFTSASTATQMAKLLGDEHALLDPVKIASIGPVTSQTLRQLNWNPTVEATTSNIAGLVEALIRAHPPQ